MNASEKTIIKRKLKDLKEELNSCGCLSEKHVLGKTWETGFDAGRGQKIAETIEFLESLIEK